MTNNTEENMSGDAPHTFHAHPTPMETDELVTDSLLPPVTESPSPSETPNSTRRLTDKAYALISGFCIGFAIMAALWLCYVAFIGTAGEGSDTGV